MTSHTIATAELLKTEGQAFEMKILGDCMSPHLKSGDRVRVESASYYRPGDIIVFREAGGRLVAHRLLGTAPTGTGLRYMTKPDNSTTIDGLHDPSFVLGRVFVNTTTGNELRVNLFRRLNCFLLMISNSACLAGRKLRRMTAFEG